MGTIRSCVLLFEPLEFNNFYILLIFEQNDFDIKTFSLLSDFSFSLLPRCFTQKLRSYNTKSYKTVKSMFSTTAGEEVK